MSVMTNQRSEGKRRGRPSKGDRHTFVTRVPRAAADIVQQRSEELGVSYGEIIAHAVGNYVGVDVPLPTAKDRDQEELPIATSA
ncbi:hypothetical protein GCM10027425_33510 [Alteromonas gracilis]